MGYTHYWDFKKVNDGLSLEGFQLVAADIAKIESKLSEEKVKSSTAGGCYSEEVVEIFNGNGEKLGVHFEKDEEGNCIEVLFNGDDSKNLSHETFYLAHGMREFEFCKTARKPYDLAVCLSLLSLKFHVRDVEISSDGDAEDWKGAFEMFKVIFPERNVTFKLDEELEVVEN